MFFVILHTVIRAVVIPLIALAIAQTTFLGLKGSFIAVGIALLIMNGFSIIYELLKILPNALLLRGGKVLKSIVRIAIELLSLIGFGLYYFANIHPLP